jgi:hypothetical protein
MKGLKTEGLFFLARIKKREKEIIDKLYEYASLYRMYHTSFGFTVDESVNSSEIISYYSTTCNEKTNIVLSGLDSFVSQRINSAYHSYDKKEFGDLTNEKIVLYVGYDSKNEILQRVSDLTSISNCRKDILFGTASLSKDRYISDISRMWSSIEPYIVGINTRRSCFIVTSPNSSSIISNKFFEELINGSECKKYEQNEEIQKSSANNFWFLYFLCAIILVAFVIFVIMTVVETLKEKYLFMFF